MHFSIVISVTSAFVRYDKWYAARSLLQPVSCGNKGDHTSNGRLDVSVGRSSVVVFHQSTPS